MTENEIQRLRDSVAQITPHDPYSHERKCKALAMLNFELEKPYKPFAMRMCKFTLAGLNGRNIYVNFDKVIGVSQEPNGTNIYCGDELYFVVEESALDVLTVLRCAEIVNKS